MLRHLDAEHVIQALRKAGFKLTFSLIIIFVNDHFIHALKCGHFFDVIAFLLR
jgi:hypothetical protein